MGLQQPRGGSADVHDCSLSADSIRMKGKDLLQHAPAASLFSAGHIGIYRLMFQIIELLHQEKTYRASLHPLASVVFTCFHQFSVQMRGVQNEPRKRDGPRGGSTCAVGRVAALLHLLFKSSSLTKHAQVL